MLQFVLLLCFMSTGVNAAKDYEKSGLKKQNEYRRLHHSPAAKLNSTLNRNAQRCAEYYIEIETIDHSCPFRDEDTGENLYMSSWSGQSPPTCANLLTQATRAWYKGAKYYDFDFPGFSQQTGHFTQLVWRSSTLVGFGCEITSNCAVAVALYSPHGNVYFEGNDPFVFFRENVLPK